MVVGALGWGYGCVSRPLGAGEPDPPVWYLNPKVEDSAFLYAVGKAEACNGEDEARQVAYDRALVSFNKRVCASVTTVADEKGGMRFTISAAHELKGTAVVYEERAPYRGKWWAWVLVTYPRAEAAKLEAYLDRPRKEYQAGLACLSKGDLAGARQRFLTVTVEYPVGQQAVFPTGAAWLELARIEERAQHLGRARDTYNQLLGFGATTPEVAAAARAALAKLPNLKPEELVRERLDGQKIAVVCLDVGAGQPYAHAGAVCEKLARGYRLDAFSLTTAKAADNDAALVETGRGQGATRLLVLRFTRKQGNLLPGSEAQLCLLVVKWDFYSAPGGRRLGAGQFTTLPVLPENEKMLGVVAANILMQKKMCADVDWSQQ